jgi:hypothetical protein
MRKALVVLLLSFVLLGFGFGQESYVDPSGGFALALPEGWSLQDFKGLKYKIIVGPIENQFATNVTIVEDAFDGDQETYVENGFSGLENAFENFQMVESGDFETDSGMAGKKVVISFTQKGAAIWQAFYIFNNETRYFLVVCSSLVGNHEDFDAIFDDLAGSFVFTE